VASGALGRIFSLINLDGANDKTISLQQAIFENVFLPFAAPVNASLMYAVSYILLWLFLMWLLYRKRIFVKI
ncbi:MAG: DUF5009 domain-containing protein, partial [Acidobacteriota bacterium]|nr:DUF5009 domain-containing protein [Acidobacteriota bacterium]